MPLTHIDVTARLCKNGVEIRSHVAASAQTGVERIFPLHSPSIASVEVTGKGKVRRARLYYLRDLRGKAARIKRAAREEAPAAAETAKA